MEQRPTSEQSITCVSVFKSGEDASITKQLTIKWIELINRIEKNKGATAQRQ